MAVGIKGTPFWFGLYVLLTLRSEVYYEQMMAIPGLLGKSVNEHEF
jgi:hypothetical protein